MAVTFISKGRYGNFMFVACAAYAYSLKHQLDFHIQDKSIAPHLWPLYHQDLRNDEWNPELEAVYVNDNQHPYRELEFKEEWRDKNIVIGTTDINTGYFQSFRYIENAEDPIRLKFGFDTIDRYRHTCSVHLRGTDYLQLSQHHPVITKDYLIQAIDMIVLRYPVKEFKFFTDDLEYFLPIIKEIKMRWSQRYFSMSIFGTEVNDFKLMMGCDYNITSNSSFSVLASILNPTEDKVVIVPHEDNYFGELNKKLDVSTLYPPHFIRIKY
jgi:hypothetical protein